MRETTWKKRILKFASLKIVEGWDDFVFRSKLPEWMFLPEWLERIIIPCWLLGHEVILDHCGKPEHAYCLWCHRTKPLTPANGR